MTGKVGSAGCEIVTNAFSFPAATRRKIGLSPWFCCSSGAANQNSVSVCAKEFLFKMQLKSKNKKHHFFHMPAKGV
jgi:hypothetical protein